MQQMGRLEMQTPATKKLLEPVEALEKKNFTPEHVSRCLALGADPNVKARTGVSALQYACLMCDPEVLKLLLQAGGDPNAIDDYGRSPLACACEVGAVTSFEQAQCVRLLASHGADVNWFKDNHERATVLHIACENAGVEAVRALLELGADPVAKNAEGRTPLSRAMNRRDTLEPAIALLEARGIGPNDAIPGFGKKTIADFYRPFTSLANEIDRWHDRAKSKLLAGEIEGAFAQGEVGGAAMKPKGMSL